jgi:DMSO/TMAO reductase YedYZ molybdopterin-dependent catalytic subunit
MENIEKHYARGEIDKANQPSAIGLIIRQKEPKVLETPLDRVDSFLTPTELFYVRSHGPAPNLGLASYRLQVDGAVRSPFSLTCNELRNMPAETRVAILECAGNSRVFLVPQVQGAQWELGAVGNAEWTGVPLCALLERAGLEQDACEIVLEGPDRSVPKARSAPSRSDLLCPQFTSSKSTSAGSTDRLPDERT